MSPLKISNPTYTAKEEHLKWHNYRDVLTQDPPEIKYQETTVNTVGEKQGSKRRKSTFPIFA